MMIQLADRENMLPLAVEIVNYGLTGSLSKEDSMRRVGGLLTIGLGIQPKMLEDVLLNVAVRLAKRKKDEVIASYQVSRYILQDLMHEPPALSEEDLLSMVAWLGYMTPIKEQTLLLTLYILQDLLGIPPTL